MLGRDFPGQQLLSGLHRDFHSSPLVSEFLQGFLSPSQLPPHPGAPHGDGKAALSLELSPFLPLPALGPRGRQHSPLPPGIHGQQLWGSFSPRPAGCRGTVEPGALPRPSFPEAASHGEPKPAAEQPARSVPQGHGCPVARTDLWGSRHTLPWAVTCHSEVTCHWLLQRVRISCAAPCETRAVLWPAPKAKTLPKPAHAPRAAGAAGKRGSGEHSEAGGSLSWRQGRVRPAISLPKPRARTV